MISCNSMVLGVLLSLEYRNRFVKLNIQNIIKSLLMLFVVIGYILVIILLIASPPPSLWFFSSFPDHFLPWFLSPPLRLAAARQFFVLSNLAASFRPSCSHPFLDFPADLLQRTRLRIRCRTSLRHSRPT